MWNYALFIPVAVSLALLAIKLTHPQSTVSIRRAGTLAAILWALSWLAVLTILYAGPADGMENTFILRREGGYWVGSALFVALPFFAVFLVGMTLRSMNWVQSAKRVAALSVAAAGWFFAPWLFFVGWVTGCVLMGYPSCM